MDNDGAPAHEKLAEYARTARSKLILLVDDSAMLLQVAKVALEAAGFRVLAAQNLRHLAWHRSHGTPDLILLDVNMPEVEGDDLAIVLESAEWSADAPIYLFSDIDPEDLSRRANKPGITGYISKRIGVDGMTAEIKRILGDPLAG